MGSTYIHRRRVEFSETDMAGIMHFANFYRYMESAEHAWFRSIGLSIHTEVDGRMIVWPRVSATCDFASPMRFEDEAAIHLTVRELSGKRLVCDYLICKDGCEDRPAARGSMTTVCCELADGHLRPTPIPPSIAERLTATTP